MIYMQNIYIKNYISILYMMAETLKMEFLQNFFNNDKFNRYLKLIDVDRRYIRDPKYKEFHKFIYILDEMNIIVDDFESIPIQEPLFFIENH